MIVAELSVPHTQDQRVGHRPSEYHRMNPHERVMKAQSSQWMIYVHTCSVSGKQYVGQTDSSVEIRWCRHIYDARRKNGSGGGCRVFGRAIMKYGPAAFDHKLIEVCSSQEQANVLEIEWIERLNTRVPNGYNLAAGGYSGPIHEETRARLVEIGREFWATLDPEQRGDRARKSWAILSPEQRAIRSSLMHKGLTSEKRAETLRKRWSVMSKAQRHEYIVRAQAGISPERWRESALRGAAARTPEARRESALRGNAKLTAEQRSARAYKREAARTPAARRESALKREAAKRARRLKGDHL